MSYMFAHCYSLVSLDLRDFNTSNVTNTRGMFNGCHNLTSVDVSSFNTSNVTDMWLMFGYCYSLTSLSLSNFNTGNVVDMEKMFYLDHDLITIYVGNNWNTSGVTSSTDMFSDCTSLVGQQGTVYDSNYIDKTYARVDGGPSSPGYLSILSV